MKKNFFLLAFVCSLLINLIQYINSSKYFKAQEVKLEKKTELVTVLKDSIHTIIESDFSLENNELAQDYFYNSGLDFVKIQQQIYNEIKELNHTKGGNPLVPYDAVNDNPFLIEKIKFLNNRWLIAEFSSGSLLGEVLIKYFVNQDKPTDFETIGVILFK